MIELGHSNSNGNMKNHDDDEVGSPDGSDHTRFHGDVHDSRDDDQVVEIIL
jgi:hypothetical protein